MPSTIEITDTATIITTQIIGTEQRVVTAWEPCDGHTTQRAGDDGERIGEITARPLPAHIEAMAGGSPERMSAAMDFHAANVKDAYAAIAEVYPELDQREDAVWQRGSVTCWAPPDAVPCQGRCGSLVVPNWLGIAWCGESGR